jgi:hypothetical protein
MENDIPETSDASPIPETSVAPHAPESSEHKHYLIKWKLAMSMQANGMNRTFHGWLGDISTLDATAYIENNLPVNAQLSAIFAIPPRVPHEQPKMIQATCKSVYCVLGNNGMFRAGIHFSSFLDNGREELEKELAKHIPHN